MFVEISVDRMTFITSRQDKFLTQSNTFSLLFSSKNYKIFLRVSVQEDLTTQGKHYLKHAIDVNIVGITYTKNKHLILT